MLPATNIMMIRPALFYYNAETAVNNKFQKNIEEVHDAATREFDSLVTLLIENNLSLTVIDDTTFPATPDSIFPNNWISFDEEGNVYLFPMFAKIRRLERKPQVISKLQEKFLIKNFIDLAHFEEQGHFLEGTGSMVLDRQKKIVYACLSDRTSGRVLDEFCSISGYRAIAFTATDARGFPIYHTNVMLCLGLDFAVVCLDAIGNQIEKQLLIKSLNETGKVIIEISLQQLDNFCGNMLQLRNNSGEDLIIMSTSAYTALDKDQRTILEEKNRLIHSPLHHIETAGGGSARCMIAEIFLPAKKAAF